ncbi:cupredoxin domain-containing protein [Paracidobacterium acidisoli]|uniref:Cytochrome c oxidase subunit II n=1 Tax=Paracidobacterium acidisoli TaxID=2303751 RepID=A0A372IPK3_9BACT|nr:cupredoxin domain-containing protein [Paracidobacterium acidisoli]
MKNSLRIVFVLVLACLLFHPRMSSAETGQTIEIHAKKYAFVPAEITLRQGQTVTLLLVTDDVDHGLSVPGLGIQADILKKQPARVVVTPTQTGDFPGVCSRFCGLGHKKMQLMIHVVP